MTNAPARSAWVVLRRGWPWFLAVVVTNALIQALLTRVGFTPRLDRGFLGLVLLSYLVAVAALTVIVTVSAMAGLGRRPLGRVQARTVAAAAVTVALVVVAAIFHPAAGVAAAVLGMLLLPVIATGSSVREITRHVLGLRRVVARAVGWIVVDIALIGLAWLSSFHTAFFLAGVYASGLSWVTTGLAVVMMLCGAASLHAAATSDRRDDVAPQPSDARSTS